MGVKQKKRYLSDIISNFQSDGNKKRLISDISNIRPRCMLIAINDECNYRCLHCDCARRHVIEGISYAAGQWSRLVDRFADYGGRIVAIIYKEPLLTVESRAKVAAIISRAKIRNLRCGLINNGSHFDKFLIEWPDLKIDYVDFSIEGMKIVQEKIRCHSSFEQVERAIILAVNNKNIRQANLIFTINAYNFKEIYRFCEYFAKNTKINFVFDVWMPYPRAPKDFAINENIFINQVLPVLTVLAKNYPNRIILDLFPEAFKNYKKIYSYFLQSGELLEDDQYGFYTEYKKIIVRFESTTLLAINSLLVSPQGKIISRLAFSKKNYLNNNLGDVLKKFKGNKHPNLAYIKNEINKLDNITLF